MGRALLILISGLVIVFGIVQKTMLERQAGVLPARSSDYINEQQNRNLSNGIMDAALNQLEQDRNWDAGDMRFKMPQDLDGTGWVKIFDEDSPADSLPPNHDAGPQNEWGQYTLLFWSQASLNGYTAQTEVLMQRDSFSKYSYFSNFEPNIWFTSDDELSGPVHTNGEFHIAGQPVFNGKVTSPNDWIGYSGDYKDPNDPQFLGGSDFASPTIPPPGTYEMNQLQNAAASGGLSFTKPIKVQLLESGGTGTVQILENTTGNWADAVLHTYTEAQYQNKVISSTQKVEVQGTLKGALTIHSADEIEIMADVTYHEDPLTNPNSGDILGLVSEGNVVVDDKAHEQSASMNNVDIHASIMALNKSFLVEDYANGSPRGTIHLVGGLIQQERGPVGTFGRSGRQTGYAKDYTYDQRLMDLVPPNFPRESIFSYLYWKDIIVERPEPVNATAY